MALSGQGRQRQLVGNMDRIIKFIAGQETRTETGGVDCTFVEFGKCYAAILPKSGGEAYIADQNTATETDQFRVRYQSADLVQEKMIIHYEGQQWDIERITEDHSQFRRAYKLITATRRDKLAIATELITPRPGEFQQRWDNASGDRLAVTDGILYDPLEYTELELDSRIWLFRSGVRMMYGIGYQIDVNINEFVFTDRLRDEPVLAIVD